MEILAVILPVALAWVGSLEWRLRTMTHDKPSRHEVENLVDSKQEISKVVDKEIKEDIRALDKKVDKVLDYLIKR